MSAKPPQILPALALTERKGVSPATKTPEAGETLYRPSDSRLWGFLAESGLTIPLRRYKVDLLSPVT